MQRNFCFFEDNDRYNRSSLKRPVPCTANARIMRTTVIQATTSWARDINPKFFLLVCR